MQLISSLSTVVVVIINILVLTNCAVNDDDGKLVFAHVVSVLRSSQLFLCFHI